MDKKYIVFVKNPTPKRVEFAAVGAIYVIDPMTGENPQKIVFQEEKHMEDFLNRFKDPAYSFLTISDETDGEEKSEGGESVEELKDALKQANDAVEHANDRVAEVTAELETANAEINRLKADVGELTGDNASTNDALREAKTEIERLKASGSGKKHKT